MNGDSFKLLPTLKDKSFDIVLTDPPYDFSIDQQLWLQNEFLRLSKSGIIVFSPPENQWVHPVDQFGFWIKPISTKNISKRYSRFVEMIFFFYIKVCNNNKYCL